MNVNILVLLYIYLQQETEAFKSFIIVTEPPLINLSSCFDIKMARMTEIKYKVLKKYTNTYTDRKMCLNTLLGFFVARICLLQTNVYFRTFIQR